MRRNEEIDRLRALAVVATIYAHIPDLWLWKVPFIEFLKRYAAGYDGVLLFFSISGFVISASLLPKLDQAFANGYGAFKVLLAFFTKRLFRITPTATLWILATFCIVVVIDPSSLKGELYGARAALFNYFNIYTTLPDVMPNMYGVYWSLSLEEQFYLVLPVIAMFFRNAYVRIAALIALLFISEFSGPQIQNAFQVSPIIGGVLLFIVDQKFDLIKRLRASYLLPRWVLIILGAGLTLMLFMLPLIRPYTAHYIVLMGAVCTLFVTVAALGKNSIMPIKGSSRLLDWLGSRSFTLYLSHLPILILTRYLWMKFAPIIHLGYNDHHNLLIFVTWLIATIFVTEICYRFFEKPLTDRGRNLGLWIEQKKSSGVKTQPE